MHRLIDFSLRNKFLVLIFTVAIIGAGVYSLLRLPIDAVRTSWFSAALAAR